MAAAFPTPTTEEYGSTKASIEQVGFIYPLVLWRDVKGDNWLIDGRTRERIDNEFRRAGKTHAENGAELKPVFTFFKGTEAEAVRYVTGLNLTRRSLNSAQRAAAAVAAGALLRRYAAKGDGKDLAEEVKEEAGDMATRVAAEYKTNREYMFSCSKLYEANHDLFQRVLGGTLSIPSAKKVAARRAQGLSDEPEEGGEPEVQVAPDKKKDKILDGLKNEVAEDLVPIFELREVVKSVKKKIKSGLDEIDEVSEKSGAKNISMQTVKADVNNIIRHLEDHMPHAPCPYCSGTGKDPEGDSPNKRCGNCKGKKFLDRIQWKQVPDELRALFEKKEDGSDYGN
jgi:hypothetical protein